MDLNKDKPTVQGHVEEKKAIEYRLPNRKCSNMCSANELLRNVAEYAVDCVLFWGYKEDTFYSNIRLAISSLACVVALYATFGLSFPEQQKSLQYCIVTFFSLLLLLFFIESFVIQNAIISVKDRKGRTVFVDSCIDRETSNIILALRQKRMKLSLENPLSRYFDTKGYIFIDNLFDDLKKLFANFEEGLTDDNKEEIKKKKKVK